MTVIVSDVAATLRRMEQTDLTQVMAIENAAYAFPWTERIFSDCLRVGYPAWVLEQDNQIIGYGMITVAVGEGHILNLCVHPRLQGKGYGRCILEHLLTMAKQLGADTLFLEVRLSNIKALNLYLDLGFNQIGKRRNYYPTLDHHREDALILALTLLEDWNSSNPTD